MEEVWLSQTEKAAAPGEVILPTGSYDRALGQVAIRWASSQMYYEVDEEGDEFTYTVLAPAGRGRVEAVRLLAKNVDRMYRLLSSNVAIHLGDLLK